MARRPSRELIGWTAGAALASSQVFGQHMPDRFTMERALADHPDPRGVSTTVAQLRSGYGPAAAAGAGFGLVGWLITGSWLPLAASGAVTALSIAQYERTFPSELRLDPARALIAGVRGVTPGALPSTATRATIYEARRTLG